MSREGAKYRQVGYQFTLDGDMVPKVVQIQKGPRAFKVSPSRLESAAYYLQHSDKAVPDPTRTVTQTHWRIVMGQICHEIEVVTQAWRGILPINQPGFRREYFSRLPQIALMIPSLKLPFVRTVMDILSDRECVMPKLSGDHIARDAVYQHIAKRIVERTLSLPPFTNTMSFPEMSRLSNLTHEFPFPDPEKLTAAWHKGDYGKKVQAIARHIHADHESRIVPGDHLPTNLRGPLTVVSMEQRMFTRINGGESPLIFSARPDALVRGASLNDPTIRITVEDTKFGDSLFDPEEGTPQAEALAAGIFVTSQMVAGLPQTIPPNGRAIEVPDAISRVRKDTSIVVKHIGLGTPDPQIKTWGNYEEPNFPTRKKVREHKDRFYALVSQLLRRPELHKFFT